MRASLSEATTPPHPDLLPASGEKERAAAADRYAQPAAGAALTADCASFSGAPLSLRADSTDKL